MVAVSSQKKKHLYRLINKFQCFKLKEEQTEDYKLVFDAVYQINSEQPSVKSQNALNAIDQIHFDLSQVLIDM